MVVQKEKINERGSYIHAKLSRTRERINERGPYNLVEWSCVNKKKLVSTLIFGLMVVYNKSKINY